MDQVFLQQAEFLCCNGEFLPGGPPALAKKLQQAARDGRPLKIKLGLDPTRPDLHLGHTVVLRKLQAFLELGHEIILIIGDATALIGDPTGRNETRPPLTPEEIAHNAETYLAQAGKVINVSKAKVMHNSEWLGKLDMASLLKLASHVTVAQMLVREDFANRYAENKPIALHEFFYPLMQGYDSVAIEADIELGGSDQRFNNLLGREIQQAYGNNNPQSVLLMPLIEGTDGKIKMSKTYPDHCINLTDSPSDMFGKIMSIPDTLIVRYAQLLTNYPPSVIDQLTYHLDNHSVNPRDVKIELAKWLIGEYHSFEAAAEAEAAFVRQFKNNEIPDDIPEVHLVVGQSYHLPTLMADHNLAPSKAEARRLIHGGGVKLEGNKISDPEAEITASQPGSLVLQVGKRRFLRLDFAQ